MTLKLEASGSNMLLGSNYANCDYKNFKHRSDSACVFCKEPKQTNVHLYFECPTVTKVLQELCNKLHINMFSPSERIIGVSNRSFNNLLIHFYVSVRNANIANGDLNIDYVWNFIMHKEKIELAIADKTCRVMAHLKK